MKKLRVMGTVLSVVLLYLFVILAVIDFFHGDKISGISCVLVVMFLNHNIDDGMLNAKLNRIYREITKKDLDKDLNDNDF